ncbi:hypothetical protein [Natronorubrum sp. FCH18a]|uniref:hypothetical protein n=1 Tax=Natronorubrum sp. FCH18a TaxID=3447018 RepID=UPI003F516B76
MTNRQLVGSFGVVLLLLLVGAMALGTVAFAGSVDNEGCEYDIQIHYSNGSTEWIDSTTENGECKSTAEVLSEFDEENGSMVESDG